jgi:hypothetical protein
VHGQGETMVCLSLVGNWAMMFQLRRDRYSAVIEEDSSGLASADREILRLLAYYGFRLLTGAEAVLPIGINLFDTPRDEARVYHAVISDDGILLDVLKQFDVATERENRGWLAGSLSALSFVAMGARAAWHRVIGVERSAQGAQGSQATDGPGPREARPGD